MSLLSRIRSAGNEQIDNTFLIYFRIVFGFILVWGMVKYFHQDLIWTCFQEPRLHFTYLGFDFVRPLPGQGMQALFLVISISAACVMLGFRYRIATAVFFLSFTYMFLLDQSWYLNHYYLVCLVGFLLLFIPADRAFSIDAIRSKELQSDTTPRWVLWLLRLQFSIPYFFGGLAKLNSDWLRGEPMRTWMAAKTDFPLIGQFFTEQWCVSVFSYGGVLFDLFVVPLLLWKRTRVPALVFCVMFHLSNHFLFKIGIFPWLMLFVTFALFPPFDLARLRFWSKASRSADETNVDYQLPAFGKLMLIGFVALQLLVPFRHYLYPGDVSLSREGHCFAWRMKLNRRVFDVRLNVHHADGRIEPVKLHEWVTAARLKGFRSPNQVQQLAKAIRKHHEEIDKKPVQIKGTTTVTVNDREPFVLIRDDVDLSRTPRSLFAAKWIETHPDRVAPKLKNADPEPATAFQPTGRDHCVVQLDLEVSR